MINRVPIKEKIAALAEDAFVQGFTQDAIKRFLAEVKSYANKVLEDRFFSNAEDEEILGDVNLNKDAFLDFSTGYVAQMQQWHREHPIEIKQVKLNIDDVCKRIDPSNEKRDMLIKHLLAAGLVTAGVVIVLAIGFTCFDPSLDDRKILVVVSILAGLTALVYISRSYANKVKTMKQMEKDQEHMFHMQIDGWKMILIGEVMKQFGDWLNAADAESDRIKQSFKL